jgi:hypothetical protein
MKSTCSILDKNVKQNVERKGSGMTFVISFSLSFLSEEEKNKEKELLVNF